jgi:hypothetical protein
MIVKLIVSFCAFIYLVLLNLLTVVERWGDLYSFGFLGLDFVLKKTKCV